MYMITKCPIFVRSAYLTQWTILTPLCPKVQSSSSDRVFVFFPSMYILLQRICQTYRTTHMLELFTTQLLPFLSFFFDKKHDNFVEWYVACTDQIAALGYVSCTDQIAALGYVSCTDQIAALGYVSCTDQIAAFQISEFFLANNVMGAVHKE